MSKWTHAICDECWDERHPEQVPTKTKHAPLEKCCFCSELCMSGIYVRGDPKETPCKGVHPNDD